MIAEVALQLPVQNLFTYKVPLQWSAQIRAGHSVLVPFRNRLVRGVVVEIKDEVQMTAPLYPATLKEIQSILNPNQPIPPALLQLTEWISLNYGCSWGESLSAIFSRPKKSRVMKTIENTPQVKKEASFSLTQEQTGVLVPIRDAIQNNSPKTFLLFGVTSSGKTEIYVRAIQEALNQKKQALFLVPEISLCQPFVEILSGRFGPRVGSWHSQKSAGEKNFQAEQIHKGAVDILVGPRSALFAPFERIGVIVLDEEHDSSYKQGEKPRYHAKDVALKLAELHRAVVILGSATPSIESFHRAERGEFALLKLKERVPNHSIPHMTCVDRKSYGGSYSPFSPKLIEMVTVALARREQVILALNRRGYSTFLLCPSCGFVWECPNCQLAFVHHKPAGPGHEEESLQCHYCFQTIKMPDKCGKCGASVFVSGGFGTQKIVQEAKKKFPASRVLRLDRDVARKKNASAEAYKIFRDETADILVGTQMIAQGLDFPRVTLVGIIDADTALHHADFRASEKTFQWITQAAGRAGRSPMGGEVVVQSSMPDHYALEAACRQDYESFYRKEIEFRRTLGYPPFSKLVLFGIESAKRQNLVAEESERLASLLKNQDFFGKIKILGPGPAPKEFLRKKLRWQVLVKCMDETIIPRIAEIGRSFTPKSEVKVVVDVDPYDIL